jgi:hypothetical protein
VQHSKNGWNRFVRVYISTRGRGEKLAMSKLENFWLSFVGGGLERKCKFLKLKNGFFSGRVH